MLERLRGEPEVTHASGVDLPFNFEWQTTRFEAQGSTPAEPDRWPEALARAVTPTYFERHGIKLVQGATEQSALLPAIRRAVWAVDPDQPLDGPSGPWTLHEWLSDRTQEPRLVAAIGNALAAIALVLATIGLYGLLSYTVARRTSEFGVRLALGASSGTVMRLVLRRTLALTIAGVALGLAAAAIMTRFLGSMLFGVAPLDPATFVAAGLIFLAVSTLASVVPLRHVLIVSPALALRTE